MDGVLSIIALLAVFVGWHFGMSALSAGWRTLTGKGSFQDNLNVQLGGMQQFQIRFNDIQLVPGDASTAAKEIQIKGLLPFTHTVRLGLLTSVFDVTSEQWQPVMSALSQFQEPNTYAYSVSNEVGHVGENVGFIGWVRAGVVIPQILSTPYGGDRKLTALLRLIDLDNPPSISSGFHSKDSTILASYSLPFDFRMEGPGYQEELELKDEAAALCIQVGVYIAMLDGVLEDNEGATLRAWIERILDRTSDSSRAALKDRLNAALRSAYGLATKGQLVLSDMTARLSKIADVSLRYQLVEHCYDMAMLDGGQRVGIVEKIAKSLELDLAEISRIRDVKIVSRATDAAPLNIEQLLGIDASWDQETIKKHLRNEFQKWNNRITALPEGEERETAQRMLDAISQARKVYG